MASTLLPQIVPTPEVEVPLLLLSPMDDGHVRFSREAYHRFGEIGVLNCDKRFELIEGEIFMMSPIGAPQGGFISRLMNFFVTRLPSHLTCRIQLSFAIGDHSEPEPDLAIVRRRDDDYLHALPTPSDVALLVEVAQSSLPFDLGRKLRLYAGAGIPEYWVLDIEHQLVLVHREPVGQQYRVAQQFAAGSHIALLAAPECRLDVSWLFR
jgi:Uma2 family endonuclease